MIFDNCHLCMIPKIVLAGLGTWFVYKYINEQNNNEDNLDEMPIPEFAYYLITTR
jgi:hypothetical protein